MKDTSLYFAYGSNINLDQMDYRCPKAVPLCTVELDGYELRFRGNSRDTVLRILSRSRAEKCTACSGRLRRNVKNLWTDMRATPSCTERNR